MNLNENQKGLAPLIIVIIVGILAIGISGGAFWYWQQNQKKIEDYESKTQELQKQLDEAKKKIEKLEEKSTSEDSSEESGTTSIDETADWKTYTNSSLGISFKYPSNYNLADKSLTYIGTDENQFAWYQRPDFVTLFVEMKASETDIIDFQVFKTTDSDKIDSAGGWESSKKLSDEKVNGNTIYSYSIDNGAQNMKALIKGNSSYVFGPTRLSGTIDKMLKTFKFTK